MSLDEYLAIDLSRASLFSQVTDEAARGEIHLTGRDSSLPSFLTPKMCDWYTDHVDGSRRIALQQINAAFASIKTKDGANCFLLQVELDTIEEQKHRVIKSEIDTFRQNRDVTQLHVTLGEKTSETTSPCESTWGEMQRNGTRYSTGWALSV